MTEEQRTAFVKKGIVLPVIGDLNPAIDFSAATATATANEDGSDATLALSNVVATAYTRSNDALSYKLITTKIDPDLIVYPGNIWTKEFTPTPVCASGNESLFNKNVSFEYSKDGGNSWIASPKNEAITGLNPGETYKVRSVCLGLVSEAKEVKTYESIQIPNSSLDEGYDISYPKKKNPLYTFKGGWIDTRNALTCHENGVNAFYVSKSSTLPISENNSTVAHMMTIGWGKGNTCVGEKKGSVIYNISAGLVCVGQYEVSSREIKPKEAYIRPTSISFVYKASPYNGDEYLIQIELVNIVGDKETVIGEGKLQSGNTIPSYTNGSVNVNYNDAYRDLPISHVRVLFKAGTKEDKDHLENDFRDASVWNGYTTAYIIGSQFWLDSFILNYDK